MVDFGATTFSGGAYFNASLFNELTIFDAAIFKKKVAFGESIFSTGATFIDARFDDNVDFRDMTVSGLIIFNNSNWEKRIDFRGISAKEIHWNSIKTPSNVKGMVDFREAQIGLFIVKEVQFFNLVDFSKATFGEYRKSIFGPPEKKHWDKQKRYRSDYSKTVSAWVDVPLEKSFLRLENNTFDNEVDFLHVKFNVSAIFINNRFRRTLDLTGVKFGTHNSQVENSHICLASNRINRLVFEPKLLGKPPGISPYRQFKSLFANPLHTSRVRRIDAPECILTTQTATNPESTTKEEEPLDDIYKTLGKSFREANDREGINEAWYLKTLAKRMNEPKVLANISWLFGDVPSRYTVDVWRTVWLSVAIMLGFYLIYLLEHIVFKGSGRMWRWLRKKPRQAQREVHILGHPDRHRAFRLRIFEPIHRRIEGETQRKYVPWRDAATLSVRSFLKIGLGMVYPDTRLLKILTTIEWLIGAFMLIHFILAVKNNLPFILPFLGVVN